MAVVSPQSDQDGYEEYGTFDTVRIVNHGSSVSVKGYEDAVPVDQVRCHVVKPTLVINDVRIEIESRTILKLEDASIARNDGEVRIRV